MTLERLMPTQSIIGCPSVRMPAKNPCAGHIFTCALPRSTESSNRSRTSTCAAGSDKLPLGQERAQVAPAGQMASRCDSQTKSVGSPPALLCFCFASRSHSNQPLCTPHSLISPAQRWTSPRSVPQSTLVPSFPCDVPSVCWCISGKCQQQATRSKRKRAISRAFPPTIRRSVPIRHIISILDTGSPILPIALLAHPVSADITNRQVRKKQTSNSSTTPQQSSRRQTSDC